MIKTIEQFYEELRAVIDGGSESMTHEDAIEEVNALKELAVPVSTRIIVDIYGGCVTSIYGDRLPAGVEIECIVRDHDNIEEGDPDPVGENYVPEVYYWE
jgi:hypothetical protein